MTPAAPGQWRDQQRGEETRVSGSGAFELGFGCEAEAAARCASIHIWQHDLGQSGKANWGPLLAAGAAARQAGAGSRIFNHGQECRGGEQNPQGPTGYQLLCSSRRKEAPFKVWVADGGWRDGSGRPPVLNSAIRNPQSAIK